MNISCSAEPCPIILDGTCVFYTGANLIYTGIVTNDSISAALVKIDQKFKDAAIGYVFQNGLIQAIPGGPVKLGGTLNQNTVITSAGYTLALTGTIESSAFITTGGTSLQFVKGDGSLDSTSYQPAGNYISALTGDGTATGPGAVPFTLATTGVIANTYGSSTQIPVITVDAKGRITFATSTSITVPPATIVFSGDVTGAGQTGTTIPLTLATVLSTPGTYGSTTTIPVVTVNAKGLVTGISQVSFPAGTGTVTSVGVSPGTGISASVANPTTTPVITITNTAPDQTVVLNDGAGINVTGTYPNFTIAATNSGTVTSVTATSPLSSTGGTTPDISIQQSSGSQAGYLSSTDWTTFNSKVGGSGTANYVSKWSLSSVLTDSQIFDNGTNVGIGTVSPSYKLDVTGTGRFTNTLYADTDIFVNNYFKIDTTSTSFPNNVGIYRRKGNGYSTYFQEDEQGGAKDKWAFVQRTGYGGTRNWFQTNSSIVNINYGWGTPNSSNYEGATLLIDPTINITNVLFTGSKVRGIYYNPTLTSLVNTTHIAYENTSGDIIHGNLATGGAAQMVTADSNGKLGIQTIPTGTVTGTGVATRVAFWDGTSSLTSNSNLYWDNTNSRLGLGNTSPITQLDLGSSTGTAGTISKIALYSSGFGTYGFGVSPAQLDYVSGGAHVFYRNSPTTDELFRIDNTGTLTSASLVGSGTRMVTTSSTGVIGSQAIPTGTVTSVGLTMPSAFSVASSPVTGSGTIAVTGAGVVSQYIRGDGSLANFPISTGGGSSVSYYLNGSVNQGVFGGVTYYEMNGTPISGTGTDFTINADGYIAQFITDAGDPNKLLIPAGNWNFETYFSVSSSGGSPSFYIELYKVSATNVFTLIASNSATPENITGGTNIDLYFTALAVPSTVLLATDRIAVRFFVTHSGRTITMHTEDNHLSQIITTFSTGLTALNGLTAQVQNFAVGTSGTDFSISSSTATHTFNLPTASASNRGALSTSDWTNFNTAYTNRITSLTTTGSSGASTLISNVLNVPTYTLSGLGGQPLATNLTSLSGLTYASASFVKMTAAGTFALDTNTYVSTARTISTTSPLSGGGDLSANRTLSISQAGPSTNGYLSSSDWNAFASKFTLPSLTSGSVLFSDGITIAEDNANFFWDNIYSRLGIGTATPFYELDIQKNVDGPVAMSLTNLNDATNASVEAYFTNDIGKGLTIIIPGSGNTTNYISTGGASNFISTIPLEVKASGHIGFFADTYIRFYANSADRMRIFSTGNVGINTTTDAGYKLDVNGTTRLNGSTTFGSTGFWDNTNTRLGINQTTPTSRLHINFNQNSVTQSDANGILLANSTAAIAGTQSISPAIVWQGNGWQTGTSASQDVRFRADVLPVQGTTNPSATWRLSSSINGSPYTNSLLYSSSGILNGQTINATTQLQALGATSTSTALSYRTTNAGTFYNPYLLSANATPSTAGELSIGYNPTAAYQLSFAAGNGTYPIPRAGIGITNLTNTAGAETGDLIFSTQSGGTAISEKMRIFAAGNVGIGTTTDAGYKIYISGTGYVSNTLSAGNQLKCGSSPSSSLLQYGTTNVSAVINPRIALGDFQQVSGNKILGYDTTNGLVFLASNATKPISRAAIDITNLVNTAGAESGDLIFLTQSGGTAMSEKMRITSAGFVGINSTSPANTLDVIRGSAGAMGRGVYETASFSYNGDMKFGLYTASSNSTHGAGLSFGQTNLTITANSYYPGFDHQYVYGATPAANAMRYNYTERNSGGTVVNYAANLMQVYGDGKIVFSPVASGVSTSVKMLLNTSTDDAVNTLQVNGSVKSTQFRLSALNTAPANAADTGTLGEIRIVNGFIYVCVATNTWQRAAIATW